jgi:hypothetical protein
MATDNTPCTVSRPKLDEMIVSVNRRQDLLTIDNAFTCQFPLSDLTYFHANPTNIPVMWLKQVAYTDLLTLLEARLKTCLDEMTIVWCLAETGQLAIVNDRSSLCAAIMNHQHSGKHLIQLYIVDDSGKVEKNPGNNGSHS